MPDGSASEIIVKSDLDLDTGSRMVDVFIPITLFRMAMVFKVANATSKFYKYRKNEEDMTYEPFEVERYKYKSLLTPAVGSSLLAKQFVGMLFEKGEWRRPQREAESLIPNKDVRKVNQHYDIIRTYDGVIFKLHVQEDSTKVQAFIEWLSQFWKHILKTHCITQVKIEGSVPISRTVIAEAETRMPDCDDEDGDWDDPEDDDDELVW